MNVWALFKSVVPDQPLLIGTVSAINDDGTSVLTMLDGATLTVRGTSVAVGSKAYARAGVIEGEAPDLSFYEIEV